MKSKHILSSDEKLKQWGYGEWVEEPDLIEFEHQNIKCRIIRVSAHEMNGSLFGGHLCGYICIPEGHPWKGLGENALYDNIDVHGGITYNKEEEDGYWIGFDCAHSSDIVPSLEVFRNKYRNSVWEKYIKDLKRRYPSSTRFNPTYKNINFVIEQCESLAEQAHRLIKNNS